MTKTTIRKVLLAALVLCMFVGLLPQLALDYNTAQAAAADIYYDFRKGNNGYPNAAADKRTAFAALTYDEVAARNTTITSGPWAYHSYSATPDSTASSSDQSNFTNGSFFYYHYDKTKGFTMLTGSRNGVLKAGIKFKGMNAGKYVPFLNINGAYLRTYSGTLTAKIYASGSSTALVTKEICLSDYPEDNTYVQLSNAVSFSASEYVLELTIDNERTMTIINGLELKAADTTRFTRIYPTNDLGVYKIVAGNTVNIPFTQLMSDGTTSTEAQSGWASAVINGTDTTKNSYVEVTNINSRSQYFTVKGLAATSTPQTIEFKNINGLHSSMKVNVVVLAAAETQSDVIYNFKKVRPINWSANHVHYFGKHIKYNHTAVGGYGEINTAISSAPWKVSSIASTSDFSTLYDGYGIEHRGNGVTDLKIQVPAGGVYMPQLQLYPTIGAQTEVTVSILTTGGSQVCSKTIAAGTTTEYINLATNGVNLSATEYIVRFNKPSTGSSKQAGANYYNGIKLVKTNNTTVTLNANGGVDGTKTSVTATYGVPMPGVDADGYLPTRTGYRFGGYYDTKDTSGTQYYTKDGRSNHVWDKTSSTATLYAVWNVNTYTVNYNANGGSGTTASSSHTYDKAATLTANGFSRTGYTFLGWSTSKTATSATYTDKASVKNLSETNQGSVTLYAVWQANKYDVTLDGQSATTAGTTSVSATYGSAMPAITAPKRTGYTFGGYYTSKNGSGTQYYTAAGASARNWDKTAATTLYAKWTANAYTVTLNDGTNTTTVSATYGSAMPGITAPTKTGYTFGGYYTEENGSGTKYYNADGSSARTWNKTAATTLYALWTANTYAVTFDDQGATTAGTASTTATYGAAMPSITVPKKTGYTFGGYYIDAACTGTQYYKADGTSARNWTRTVDTTLYAKWTANTYTVKFNANAGSGTMSDQTFTYDVAQNLTANTFTRTGYTFAGWSLNSVKYTDGQSVKNLAASGSVTLYATWTPNTYTVTLSEGGTVTATYNSAMPAITVPTKTGYTFGGYYIDAACTGTQYYNADGSSARNWTRTVDTTLYAKWIAKTTTVTLDADGSTITATYGQAMPTITPPKKAGKVFDGYYKESDFSGTKYYNADGSSASNWNRSVAEVTIYAKWIDATVTINSISAKSVTALNKLTFTASGSTNSGKGLTYSSDNLPEGATLSSSGAFAWTPALEQIGTYNVAVTANDGGVTATTIVKITVTAPTSNITFANIDDKTATAGDEVEFTVSATSSLGQAVTITASNLPIGATYEDGVFSWATDLDQIGSHTVTFTASDNYGEETTTVTITVKAPKATVTLIDGETVQTVTATYGEALPAIVAPEKVGYVFAGYFTEADGAGEQYYKADGTSAKAWDKTVDIELYANWLAGEITITQIEDKTVQVEEELTFTIEAESTAPGDITYTAENLPEGATFDEVTGEFSWIPEADQVGEYTIIFKGSDGINYAEVTVIVEVVEIQSAVSFDYNDDEFTAIYGAALPKITAPERAGYIFDGYYDGENGTGTKYYNANGTAATVWDKKDASVTLYAKWIEGDDRFGTRIGGIKNMTYIADNGKRMYRLFLLAGLDSLNYQEVGFEVTVNGNTRQLGTNKVFRKLNLGTRVYEGATFGPKCSICIVQSISFGESYKDAVVIARPYAIDNDGNYVYGKSITVDGIYDKLVNDGDLEIDGEVEYD